MTTLPQKYYVYLKEDKDDQPVQAHALPQGEYFVLRKNDVFALAALKTYIESLTTAIKLDEANDFLEEEDAARLVNSRDGLEEMCMEWSEEGAFKLPD